MTNKMSRMTIDTRRRHRARAAQLSGKRGIPSDTRAPRSLQCDSGFDWRRYVELVVLEVASRGGWRVLRDDVEIVIFCVSVRKSYNIKGPHVRWRSLHKRCGALRQNYSGPA